MCFFYLQSSDNYKYRYNDNITTNNYNSYYNGDDYNNNTYDNRSVNQSVNKKSDYGDVGARAQGRLTKCTRT